MLSHGLLASTNYPCFPLAKYNHCHNLTKYLLVLLKYRGTKKSRLRIFGHCKPPTPNLTVNFVPRSHLVPCRLSELCFAIFYLRYRLNVEHRMALLVYLPRFLCYQSVLLYTSHTASWAIIDPTSPCKLSQSRLHPNIYSVSEVPRYRRLEAAYFWQLQAAHQTWLSISFPIILFHAAHQSYVLPFSS